MSSEDEQDSSEYLRPMEKIKDPRQCFFAIICNVCRYRCGTLQEMRLHVTRNCPIQPRRIELFCGHCGEEFYGWPEMVEHLNQKDIHNQPAFRPEYVFPADVRPDITLYPEDPPPNSAPSPHTDAEDVLTIKKHESP